MDLFFKKASGNKIALAGFVMLMTIVISLGLLTVHLESRQSHHVKVLLDRNFRTIEFLRDIHETTDQLLNDLSNLPQDSSQLTVRLMDMIHNLQFRVKELETLNTNNSTTFRELSKKLGTMMSANAQIPADPSSIDTKELRQIYQTMVKMEEMVKQLEREQDIIARQEYTRLVENSAQNQQVVILALIGAILLGGSFTWYLTTIIKRKEVQIKQRQQLNELLLENSLLSVFVADYDGNIRMVNKAACDHLEYTRNELLHKKVMDLDASYAALEQCRAVWDQVSGGNKLQIESQHRTKSGKLIDVELNFSSFHTSDESEELYLVFVSDLTEKNRDKVALRNQKDRLKMALEGTQAAIWDWNIKTNEIVVDDRWAELIGYSLEELEPTISTWQDHSHPEDLKEANKQLLAHFEGKTAFYDCRMRMRHKKGHWVWIWDRGKVMAYDDQGKPERMAGTHIDISELVSKEQALAASEAKFRQVIDAFRDLVYTYDTNLRVTGVYGVQAYDTAFTPETLLGKKPSEFMGEEVGKELEAQYQTVLDTGEPLEFEWDNSQLNLPLEYFNVNVSPLYDQQQISGLLVVARYITERKKFELQLQREKDKLAFLANKGAEILLQPEKNQTLSFIGQSVSELIEQPGIVMVTDYTIEKGKYTITNVEGDKREIKRLSELFDFHPLGYTANAHADFLQKLKAEKGFVIINSETLAELGFIPKEGVNPAAIESLSNLTVRAKGIIFENEILANITLITPTDYELDEDLMVTFLNQASAALENKIALAQLSESRQFLQASQKKFQTLVDTAPVVLYEYKDEAGGLFYSEQAKELLGYTREELLKTPDLWGNCIHEDDRRVVNEAIRQFHEGMAFDITYRIRHKSGNWKWFRDTSINHGEGSRIIRGLVLDITKEKELSLQLKKQMAELREHQIKFRVAVKSANAGIIDWDIINDSATWNSEMAEILQTDQLEHPDFLGILNQITINNPEKTELFDQMKKIVAGDQDLLNQINETKTADGRKWLRSTGILIEKTAEGKGQRMIGSILDITDIKKAELALEESNRQLKLLIENVPAIIFSCYNDEHYTMDYLSDYVKVVTGYAPDEINPGKVTSFKDLIYEDDLKSLRNTIAKAFDNHERYTCMYRVTDREGNIRWLNEVGEFKTYDQPASSNKVDGIIFDITDNIKAEEQKLTVILDTEDRERSRLAGEIHDNLQQKLVTAFYNFQSLKKEANHLSDKLRKRLELGMDSLNEGINETRSLAQRLMPRQIEDFGLVDTLENLFAYNQEDVKFDFYFNKNERYDSKIELNLYRITQEALSNILKHAEAEEVFVQLIQYDSTLSLSIEDDGKGFDLDNKEVSGSGFGIHAMKSRAVSINARFDLTSKPGKGTFLIVEVPLKF